MAAPFRTPGVFITEVSTLPPSVVAVETAIPAFLGYTANGQYRGETLENVPKRITSYLEFEQVFGGPPALGGFVVTLDPDGGVIDGIADPRTMDETVDLARFRLAHAVRHYFLNGGGPAYVVSLGAQPTTLNNGDIVDAHEAGLAVLAREDEPTLIVMPELSAMSWDDADELAAAQPLYHSVLVKALAQCADLGDRFLVSDILNADQPGQDGIAAFRNGIGTANLRYGAIYHPMLVTTLSWNWDEATITSAQSSSRNDDGDVEPTSTIDGLSLAALREGDNANPGVYGRVRAALDRFTVPLPPGPAIAGAYARTDRTRGVWKSPGNVSLAGVLRPTVEIDTDLNDFMNVHSTGKSVNAIRQFTGRGLMVWGARTLDGNSNEWRYVSVRRFFNMVEESTKKASFPFVFAPNAAPTWARVKAMIENFLVNQWRAGALVGAKPEDAFYVRVGLGTTMTTQDVLEGRMNVEIGMAVVRPAEFIELRFSHKLPEA